MKKTIVLISMIISCFCLTSCEANKEAEDTEQVEEKEEGGPNIQLYVTSCESDDSMLCDRAACIPTDDVNCSIEDYYFTLKGNVIQRIYCAGEDEAAWIIGKYRVGDSGMICQMDKVYIVNLSKKGGTTINYNRGRYMDLNNKEPFLLYRSSCDGLRFQKRYTEEQKAKRAEEGSGSTPLGRMYFENTATERTMLEEMRKVKALKEL